MLKICFTAYSQLNIHQNYIYTTMIMNNLQNNTINNVFYFA